MQLFLRSTNLQVGETHTLTSLIFILYFSSSIHSLYFFFSFITVTIPISSTAFCISLNDLIRLLQTTFELRPSHHTNFVQIIQRLMPITKRYIGTYTKYKIINLPSLFSVNIYLYLDRHVLAPVAHFYLKNNSFCHNMTPSFTGRSNCQL